MKKLLTLVLVLALFVPAFAMAEDAPYEIEIMLPDFYTEAFQAEDNAVIQAMEAATNTKLTFTFVADAAYLETLSLTLSDSANMPEIIVIKGHQDPVFVSSARAGAFWDITDYIDDFEYLSQGSDVVYDAIKIDGSLYGIYRSRALARNGIIYRSDWAEELGLGVPETLDDLANMAKAFTDPAKGTYGIVMCKYVDGTIKIATIMHGAPNTWGVNENGDIYPAHEDAKFIEGLTWLRDLYAAGAINQDFMVLESTNWVDPIRNNQAGIKLDCMDDGYRQQEWFETNKGETEIIFNMIPFVKNAEGEERMWPTAGHAGEVSITKAVKTEEDLLKCLAFLDFLNSPEGQTLANWGVEGVTYWTDEEGYRIATPDKEKEEIVLAVQHSINQIGMGVPGALDHPMKQEGLRKLYNDNLLTYQGYVIGNPCAAFVSETATTIGTQLNTLLEDGCVQYIANQISLEELQAIFTQWSEEGGAQMTAEMNEMYHAAQAE
ncbi:MAG: extracellular solute-binding protein [Oscillospiraceae bacterium]|nr:extracellular solute-binding protein [Oscillospiraceae bacterium]